MGTSFSVKVNFSEMGMTIWRRKSYLMKMMVNIQMADRAIGVT